MAGTKQELVTSLKPGRFVLIDGVACKINKIDISKTGKHGHAKCRIDASSLIDNSRKVMVLPGHEKVDVPIIEKRNAQVLSIYGDVANVMDIETYESFDLKIPGELKGRVVESGSVVYWVILEEKIMKEVK